VPAAITVMAGGQAKSTWISFSGGPLVRTGMRMTAAPGAPTDFLLLQLAARTGDRGRSAGRRRNLFHLARPPKSFSMTRVRRDVGTPSGLPYECTAASANDATRTA